MQKYKGILKLWIVKINLSERLDFYWLESVFCISHEWLKNSGKIKKFHWFVITLQIQILLNDKYNLSII